MLEEKIKQQPEWVRKLNDFIINHVSRVPFVQKILFVHNLQIMVKAGLSIVDGLRILGEQIENKKLQKVIKEIKIQVEKGSQLSEVLAAYPKIFPAIYVSMVAAGEVAGKMEQSLSQISDQMKKSHELAAKVRGALIYPAVIIIAVIGISIEMVFFVLPKIVIMFKDFGAALPLPTRILIAVVEFVQNHGLEVAVGLTGLVTFWIWLEKKPPVKRVVHTASLRLPIIGEVIKKINLANFALTLSSLLQSAIPIIDAMKITSNVQGNTRYREDLLAGAEALKKGDPLSEILAKSPNHFPPMVVQMIMVGEQSGQVEAMLTELSEYYSNEVDATMKNFSTIIEPLIILTLGLVVAGIAVAVIMPMYSLAQSF